MTHRLGFAGTPQLARVCLDAMLNNDLVPEVVLTQPDRPAGRGHRMAMPPVKQLAEERGIAVLQPESLRDEQPELRERLQSLDLLVVVAYGLIFPPWLLQLPQLGCVNLHFSLLPKWRGAAPIQRAIEAGEPSTGLSLIQMDEGLDTGPLLAVSSECKIRSDDTAGSLQKRLADIACKWLPKQLHAALRGELQPRKQPKVRSNKDNYARKIDRDETWLNWQQRAEDLERKIRALNPAPGALTYASDRTLKILRARVAPPDDFPDEPKDWGGCIIKSSPDVIAVVCGIDKSVLYIEQAQLQGKRVQSARELRNGYPDLFSPDCYLVKPPDSTIRK